MKKQFLLGLMAMLLPLTLWALTPDDEDTPEIPELSFVIEGIDEDGEIPYQGDNTAPTITFKYYDGLQADAQELPEGVYEVSYTLNGEDVDGIRNAGHYKMTVKGTKGAYQYYDPLEIEFDVKRAELSNLTFTDLEREYSKEMTGSILKGHVTFGQGLLESQEDDDAEVENALSCLSLRLVEEKEKVNESNIVEVSGLPDDDKNPSNYYYKGKTTLYMTVVPTVLKVTLAEESAVYTGEKIDVEDLISLEGSVKEGENVALQVKSVEGATTEDTSLLNADTYTITVELTGDEEFLGNYELAEDKLTFTINQAVLYIRAKEDAKLSKVYDGTSGDENGNLYLTDQFNFYTDEDLSESVSAESIGVKMKMNAVKEVGKNGWVNVYYGSDEKLVSTTDYKTTGIPNYLIDYTRVKFVVTPKPVTYYFTSKGKTYDGKEVEELAETDYEVVGEGFVGGDDFDTDGAPKAEFAESETEVKNVGEYPLKEADGTTIKIVKEDGTDVTVNYTVTPKATTSSDDEASATAEEETEEVSVNVYKITPATMTIVIENLEVPFETSINEEALATALANHKKDTNKTRIAAPGVDQTALNKERGDIRGLITLIATEATEGGKKITVQFPTEEELEAAGEEIQTEYANYTLVVTDGLLTVAAVSDAFELDGSEGLEVSEDAEEEPAEPAETETNVDKLKKYNGAKIQKVTVKNFINYVGIPAKGEAYKPTTKFVEGLWYMLSLPFEVEVRTLSAQLGGYAIVNVPDASKTGGKEAYFKLELKTVPANTLMLFKVDRTYEKFDDMTFTDVTIDVPTEEIEEGVLANNYDTDVDFVSVYKKTNINSKEENFMLNDILYVSNTVNNDEGLDVYPFNGFIRFAEGTFGARIFVQEADGSTTAINAVTGETIKNAAEGWYTVGGMKLNGVPTEKGIYINNGQKVVIK